MRGLGAVVLALLITTACRAEVDQPNVAAGVESTPAPTQTGPLVDLDSVQFATSFGECSGYCADTLTFAGQSVSLTSTDRAQTNDVVNEGVVDVAAFTLATEAVGELRSVQLRPVYGCPDCLDGGATSITMNGTVHEYEFVNPPEDLAPLDELFLSLRDALRRCESNELVTVAAGCTSI